MATLTPRANHESLHPTLGAARLTLGNRILLSFGVLFVLMLVMAGVSYERLRAINAEAVSIERDSLPGVYLAASLRGAVNESFATLQQATFVDTSPSSWSAISRSSATRSRKSNRCRSTIRTPRSATRTASASRCSAAHTTATCRC
jgi:hypothetical protein